MALVPWVPPVPFLSAVLFPLEWEGVGACGAAAGALGFPRQGTRGERQLRQGLSSGLPEQDLGPESTGLQAWPPSHPPCLPHRAWSIGCCPGTHPLSWRQSSPTRACPHPTLPCLSSRRTLTSAHPPAPSPTMIPALPATPASRAGTLHVVSGPGGKREGESPTSSRHLKHGEETLVRG